MRYYNGGGPGGWGMGPIFGLLMMLLFIALVVLLVSFFFRRPFRRFGLHDHEPPLRGTNALTILDERLARGEIDIEEYTKRREVLKRHQEE